MMTTPYSNVLPSKAIASAVSATCTAKLSQYCFSNFNRKFSILCFKFRGLSFALSFLGLQTLKRNSILFFISTRSFQLSFILLRMVFIGMIKTLQTSRLLLKSTLRALKLNVSLFDILLDHLPATFAFSKPMPPFFLIRLVWLLVNAGCDLRVSSFYFIQDSLPMSSIFFSKTCESGTDP